MRKNLIIFLLSSLFLCSCGKDVSEYGGSSLMAMSDKKPSNVTAVTRTVSIPHTYEQLETEVVLPEPSPELILTEQDKSRIATELYNALQEYYDSIYVKKSYDADVYFNAFDNDTVRARESKIVSDVAYRNGITEEELLSFYPYQFKSNEVASLDKEQIRNDKEQEGYAYLEDSYQEVIDEFIKREKLDDNEITFYRTNNQFVINCYLDNLAFASFGSQDVGDRIARQDIDTATSVFKGLSSTLKGKLDNDYGLNKGIVTVSLYDKAFPNKVLFVYTNGEQTYNYLDYLKEDNPDWLLEYWEYLGE